MDRRTVPIDGSGSHPGVPIAAGPPAGGRPAGATPSNGLHRRDFLKLTVGGGAALSLDGLLDVSVARAAARDLKLADVSEFTTACNFCSCGCGMIAAVRDGKLITMEGDYDHIVSRGSLCVKGISMFATHASPKRLTKPTNHTLPSRVAASSSAVSQFGGWRGGGGESGISFTLLRDRTQAYPGSPAFTVVTARCGDGAQALSSAPGRYARAHCRQEGKITRTNRKPHVASAPGIR